MWSDKYKGPERKVKNNNATVKYPSQYYDQYKLELSNILLNMCFPYWPFKSQYIYARYSVCITAN